MVIRLMKQRVVTHLSVCHVRVVAFDVEHITCGTFSSPSECVVLATSVLIDSVVHASCDACHSTLMTSVTAFWSCRTYAAGSQERLRKAGGIMPSGDASKGERVNTFK